MPLPADHQHTPATTGLDHYWQLVKKGTITHDKKRTEEEMVSLANKEAARQGGMCTPHLACAALTATCTTPCSTLAPTRVWYVWFVLCTGSATAKTLSVEDRNKLVATFSPSFKNAQILWAFLGKLGPAGAKEQHAVWDFQRWRDPSRDDPPRAKRKRRASASTDDETVEEMTVEEMAGGGGFFTDGEKVMQRASRASRALKRIATEATSTAGSASTSAPTSASTSSASSASSSSASASASVSSAPASQPPPLSGVTACFSLKDSLDINWIGPVFKRLGGIVLKCDKMEQCTHLVFDGGNDETLRRAQELDLLIVDTRWLVLCRDTGM